MESLQLNTLNLQIQHKRDTLDNWLNKNPTYAPLEGELIIVTDPHEEGQNSYQDVKYVLVGDGHSFVANLISNNAIKLGSISKTKIEGMFPELHKPQ
jgi:hypothetical protein